jgi:hypothetical protein
VGLPVLLALWGCLCCPDVRDSKAVTASINQSINVTSVAMRYTEDFMQAIHQTSLGLIVVFDC